MGTDGFRAVEGSGRNRPPGGLAQAPAVLMQNPGFLLGKVHELARDRFEEALAALGLKARHYGALAAMAEQGPLAQNALGERLGIDRSTMVAVIDELEAAGHVLRRRNPVDRRAYQLELTDDGHATFQRAVHLVAEVKDEVFAPLDRSQRDQLETILTTLLRHLTVARAGT